MKLALWAAVAGVVSLFAGPCDVPEGGDGGSAPRPGVVDAPVRDFVSVAVGGAGFACGLWDDGLVGCWGSEPSSVAPEGEFTAIVAGLQELCGIRAGGEIHCWGGNEIHGVPGPGVDDGMMGDEDEFGLPVIPVEDPLGDPPERLLAESVPSGAFAAVGVGDGAACGIRQDGGLVCWGPVGAMWEPPAGRFGAVAVGVGAVACGIRVDGAVACWGEVSERWAPPAGRFGAVDVAAAYACGLRVGGGVVCWGPDPVVGQDWVEESGGWSPPGGVFADVALNDDFACAVRADGEVQCWGPQGRHECADGRLRCFGWDATPLPPGPFTSISVAKVRSGWYTGPPQVCGIRPGGDIVCWNDTVRDPRAPSGAFMDVNEFGSCGVRAGGEAVCWWGGVEYAMAEGEYTAMSGGRNFGCGLRAGGEITCWGSNRSGAASPPPGSFTAIDVDSYLGCGLRPDGEAVCWGFVEYGGLGDPPPGPFTAIEVRWASGGGYACGLRAGATADCWGPTAALRGIIPAEVFALPDFATDPRWRGSVPGGPISGIEMSPSVSRRACGIHSDGEVVCWSPEWPPGAWTSGEFPRGDPGGDDDMTAGGGDPVCDRQFDARQCRGVPRGLDWVQGDVSGGSYVALDSGWYDTCGLRSDGTVDCWGDTPGSPQGQFSAIEDGGIGYGIRPDGEVVRWGRVGRDSSGRGVYEVAPSTLLVAPVGRRFVALDSGLYDVCGLLDDGALVCTHDLPDLTEQGGPFTRFSVGGGDDYRPERDWDYTIQEHGFVCAIRADGGIDCWGANHRGQATPALDIAPYSDVTTGFAHTCAIGAGGEVICWGDDRYDQTKSPPGAFGAISAGQWHTCGLRPDGNIDCWGNGPANFDLSYDAPPPDRPTEPPAGPFTAIAAGFWHTCALRPDGEVTCWLSY